MATEHPCQLLAASVHDVKRPSVAGAQSTCTGNKKLPILAFKAIDTYAVFQAYEHRFHTKILTLAQVPKAIYVLKMTRGLLP